MLKISLYKKVGFYDIKKEKISIIIIIGSYLQGKFSNEICGATERNNLNIINITTQILGGAEYFIKNRENFIEHLREFHSIQQAPSASLEAEIIRHISNIA